MKLRTGLVAGAALGYYIGAKAGRERYEQLNKVVKAASGSSAFKSAMGKTKALASLGLERSRDLLRQSESELAQTRPRAKTSTKDPGGNRGGNIVFLADTLKSDSNLRRYY